VPAGLSTRSWTRDPAGNGCDGSSDSVLDSSAFAHRVLVAHGAADGAIVGGHQGKRHGHRRSQCRDWSEWGDEMEIGDGTA